MKKLTTKEFILRANYIHKNNYDYSKSIYLGNKAKIIICCKKHGPFQQKPNDHLNGRGCAKCGFEKTSQTNYSTTDEFIKRANDVHDNKYDYSLTSYTSNKSKVKIICLKHGVFEQNPNNHLSGQNCPICSPQKKMLSTKEFISVAKKNHGKKYDYSLVIYRGNKNTVNIKCKTHGSFKQTPNSHVCGQGCPKCVGKNKTTEDFIAEAKRIHGKKYDYSLTHYVNSKSKTTIICSKHGQFKQMAGTHLSGCGCPKCGESMGEKGTRVFLENNDIKYVREKRFDDCFNIIPLSFDFYLQEKNVLIEYDGMQHFKPINYFGGITSFNKMKINDIIKNNYATKHNIKLIRIAYNENIEEKLITLL